MRHLAVAGIIGDSVAAEFMLLAEEVKNMKSVDELLEIQHNNAVENRAVFARYHQRLIRACRLRLRRRASEETAVELLELVNRLDEQSDERFCRFADARSCRRWRAAFCSKKSGRRAGKSNNRKPSGDTTKSAKPPRAEIKQHDETDEYGEHAAATAALLPSPSLNQFRTSFYSKPEILTIMLERLNRAESSRMRPDLEAAIEYLPGLASLALWCRFADTDEDAIAFTDGSTIYAGADYEKFDDKERRFICLHEILHIALCHPQRFAELEKRDAVGFQRETFEHRRRCHHQRVARKFDGFENSDRCLDAFENLAVSRKSGRRD